MSRLPVDTEAIRTLAEILQDTGLTEIEISEKDSRIRVVRAPAIIQAAVPVAAAAAAPAPAPAGVVCAACSTSNPAGAKFCMGCGQVMAPAVRHCTECGTELPGAAKFCANCGTAAG